MLVETMLCRSNNGGKNFDTGKTGKLPSEGTTFYNRFPVQS